MAAEYIAHVKREIDGRWKTHLLEEHLYEVAGLAEKFAQSFDSKDWAYLAGLWHDLGKYRPAFQAHIKKSSGYEPDAHITSEKSSNTSHASTGVVHAMENLEYVGRILAYTIAGHHTGLLDFEIDDSKGRALKEIINRDKIMNNRLMTSISKKRRYLTRFTKRLMKVSELMKNSKRMLQIKETNQSVRVRQIA